MNITKGWSGSTDRPKAVFLKFSHVDWPTGDIFFFTVVRLTEHKKYCENFGGQDDKCPRWYWPAHQWPPGWPADRLTGGWPVADQVCDRKNITDWPSDQRLTCFCPENSRKFSLTGWPADQGLMVTGWLAAYRLTWRQVAQLTDRPTEHSFWPVNRAWPTLVLRMEIPEKLIDIYRFLYKYREL